jgi:hypothetical protein
MDEKVEKAVSGIVARLLRRFAVDAVFDNSMVKEAISKEKLKQLRAQTESELLRLELEGSKYQSAIIGIAEPLVEGITRLGQTINELLENNKNKEEK